MVTGVVLELDKFTTPYYVLDSVDWGNVEGTHHSYKYVNQIGVTVTDTSLGTRELEIVGWVLADTEMQMSERKSLLNNFVNPQQPIELTYNKYQLKFLPNSSIGYGTQSKENNEIMCKFKIEGLAADPLFKDDKENRVSAATTKGLFSLPLVIGKKPADTKNKLPTVMFGLREPNILVSVYNHGTVSTGMRIVFKATGTLSNPSLINVYTQEYFKINKTMLDGEVIEVVTTTGEKKVVSNVNGVQSNCFKYKDLDSTWLQLGVGDNVFRYNADDGIDNLEVYIYFYNKYLEVQECY